MNRRQFAAFVGTSTVAGIGGGYFFRDWLTSLNNTTTVNHSIRVWNDRETPQEVTVRWSFDGEQHESGPQVVEPSTRWQITRFTSRSELSVEFHIEDEQVWEDTHEVPKAHGTNGESWVGITLQPTEEIETHFLVTD